MKGDFFSLGGLVGESGFRRDWIDDMLACGVLGSGRRCVLEALEKLVAQLEVRAGRERTQGAFGYGVEILKPRCSARAVL